MVHYICECGCEHTDETIESRSFQENGGQRRAKFCPDHRDCRVVSKYIYCLECGIRRDFPNFGGQQPRFCKPCQKERSRLQKQASYKEKYPKYKKAPLTYKQLMVLARTAYDHLDNNGNKWDCTSREDCIKTYDGFYAMPCPKCEFYKSKMKEVA